MIVFALIPILPATAGVMFYLLRGIMLGEWRIARLIACVVLALTSLLFIWGMT